MAENLVLAIDPGREKCGIAVVHRQQGVITQTIIATTELREIALQLMEKYQLTIAVIGDRTTSQTAQAVLAGIQSGGQQLAVIPVNEHRSTDEARKRYWQDQPPTGWKRLLPTTMQVPPRPVDDYVAVILAERYFAASSSQR